MASVKVGQKVVRTPRTIETIAERNGHSFGVSFEIRPMRGVVVYVHPKGRFHVVEFENSRGEKLRESFDGVE